MASRRMIVGVMGSGKERHAEWSVPLGALLGELGVHLLTGGGQGVMIDPESAARLAGADPRRDGYAQAY